MFNKYIVPSVAIIALVLGLVGLVGGNSSQPATHLLGGVTNYDTIGVSGLKVGSGCNDTFGTCTGTTESQLIATTCNLIGMDVSHAASTTKAYDCAVSNVTSANTVFAQLATSTQYGTTTQGASQSWSIVGAAASSTSGFVTVLVQYFGGAAAVPSSFGIGSSTKIWAFK